MLFVIVKSGVNYLSKVNCWKRMFMEYLEKVKKRRRKRLQCVELIVLRNMVELFIY